MIKRLGIIAIVVMGAVAEWAEKKQGLVVCETVRINVGEVISLFTLYRL